MTIEQRFIACNGRKFKTEEDCLNYETSISKIQNVIPALRTIQKICDTQMNCGECIFCDTNTKECMFTQDVPEWWNLSKIDKRTGD